MTDIDTAALRAAAEAATPGPWDAEGDQVAQAFDDGMAVGGIVHASWEQQGHHDVAYIAAANPAVVLALLDEVEFLRAEDERAQAIWIKYSRALRWALGSTDNLQGPQIDAQERS